MVKINKRLLPIKAHFLFFMGAMGPILPQLAVLGKQIGIPPDIMGYITSILPIMYVIAKPLFGYLADYFAKLRKLIFMILIVAMTLSFASFYFIPTPRAPTIDTGTALNITFDPSELLYCYSALTSEKSFCTTSRLVNCTYDQESFVGLLLEINTKEIQNYSDNITNNVETIVGNLHMCIPPTSSLLLSDNNKTANVSSICYVDADLQPECIYDSNVFWSFVVFMCIGTIGFNVVNSISDAICFDVLGDDEGSKYGAQRVWGTIGFGTTALLGGIVVNLWTLDNTKSFTPALLIMLIFSGLDILSVSNLKLPKFSTSESIFKDVWDLIKRPSIGVFLIFATIAGILDSFIIYFMFWHLEEVAASTGYMHQIKLIEGCVVAAECLAGEVPFFFYSGKIIKKLGYVHCMSLCFFFYAIRLGLIGWIPNPWYLVGVELFLQGCTYALCYTCIVAYAAAVAPPGTSATVQGLMAGMDDGLGFSIGSLIGGLSYKCFGGRSSFYGFSFVAFCTCILHLIIRPSSRKQLYLPKEGYETPKEHVKFIPEKTESVTQNQ